MAEASSESVVRIAAQPLIALPGAGPDGLRADRINLSDLHIDGHGPSVDAAEALVIAADLDARLAANPGDTRIARIATMLWDRIAAHIDVRRRRALADAMESLTAEDLLRDTAPGRHTDDRIELARRASARLLAGDLRESPRTIRVEARIADRLASLPRAEAAAMQGLLSREKCAHLTGVVAKLPEPHASHPAIEEGLLSVVVDASPGRGRRQAEKMIAPILAARTRQEFDERLRDEARVRAMPLGGGLAELRVIDRAENIAALVLVAEAGARTLKHGGATGSPGQLRAEVLGELAKRALREQAIPTAYGASVPLERDHGCPVQLKATESPAWRVFPGADIAANSLWELPDVGVLTQSQVETLRDDPSWTDLVAWTPLLRRDDVDYLDACRSEKGCHDPSLSMQQYVRRRDGQRCRAPDCDDDTPPTDFHHVQSFAKTGVTSIPSLISLHSGCHQLVHHAYEAVMHADGTVEFTDRHGQTRTTRPEGLAEPAA